MSLSFLTTLEFNLPDARLKKRLLEGTCMGAQGWDDHDATRLATL